MKDKLNKLCLVGALMFISSFTKAGCTSGYSLCMEISEWDYVWDNAECGRNINCQTTALLFHLLDNDQCGRDYYNCIFAKPDPPLKG